VKIKVILEKDIPNLGVAGDVKDVAPGYARNYLLPRRLAVPASPRATARWDAKKDQVTMDRRTKLAAAQAEAKRIEGIVCGIGARAGEDGKLFGSVTTTDVARVLAEKGVMVDRRWVEIRVAIRTVGDFTGAVRLHPQVRAEFKIQVSPLAA
jgi:large subunit ribosomal protein L9